MSCSSSSWVGSSSSDDDDDIDGHDGSTTTTTTTSRRSSRSGSENDEADHAHTHHHPDDDESPILAPVTLTPDARNPTDYIVEMPREARRFMARHGIGRPVTTTRDDAETINELVRWRGYFVTLIVLLLLAILVVSMVRRR